ncbi:MAG: branched-chain amino acid ABC transporter permease [Desulfurococcales archaeon]|nr:branched-chain amino acid ABC transporter permease [Desulfurococcales archaeon]
MLELTLTGEALTRGIIVGLIYGSVLGAVAAGLTIIWGVMKVVNLAHGHILVFAAMMTAYLYLTYQGAMIFTPPIAFVWIGLLGALFGAFFYYVTLHPIIGHVDTMTLKYEMSSLMATFGFGIALYGIHYVIPNFVPTYSTEPSIGYSIGAAGHTYLTFLGVTLEKSKLLMSGLSFLLVITAHGVMNWTSMGLKIRAVAQDARALSLVGVNPVKVKVMTAVVATAFAMASGVLFLGYANSVSPNTESIVAPLCFVIVVLGGLGSVLGTYLGGLLLGIIYQLTLELTGQTQQIAFAIAFAVLIIALVLKPNGVFGDIERKLYSLRKRGE